MSGDTWLAEAVQNGHIRYVPWNCFHSIEPVAKGGYGVIKRAVWKTRKKEVALKSLKGLSYLDENKKAEAYKELINELKLLRNFADDDRIIRFYGLTKDPCQNYIVVMQYANGGTLREYLASTFANLSWHDKLRMAIEIASAVDCLHSENIVHRDLHSKNILIHNSRALIADFGLSRRAESECSASSKPVGVIAYIDPQRVCNPRLAHEKLCDVYSFGVLLWELSSGRVPFNGRNDLPLFFEILSGLRETPVAGTPVDYQNLYTECWDFDLDRRPQSAEVLLQRLGRMSLKLSPATSVKRTTENVVQKDNNAPLTVDLSLPSNIVLDIQDDADLAPCGDHVETPGLNLDLTKLHDLTQSHDLTDCSHNQDNHGEPVLGIDSESANDLMDGTTRVVDDAVNKLSWGTLAEVSNLLAQHLAASKAHNEQRDDAVLQRIAEMVVLRAFDLFPRNPRFNGNGKFNDLSRVRQQEVRSAFASLSEGLNPAHGKESLFDPDKHRVFQEDVQCCPSPLETRNDQYDPPHIGHHFKEQLVSCFIEAFCAKFPLSDPKVLDPGAPQPREQQVLKYGHERWKIQRLRTRRTRKIYRDKSTGTASGLRRGRLRASMDHTPHDPGGTRYCERQPTHSKKKIQQKILSNPTFRSGMQCHNDWEDQPVHAVSKFEPMTSQCPNNWKERPVYPDSKFEPVSRQHTLRSADFFQFFLMFTLLYPVISQKAIFTDAQFWFGSEGHARESKSHFGCKEHVYTLSEWSKFPAVTGSREWL